MGEQRIDMQADPTAVEAAMNMLDSLPGEHRERYLRAIFDAIYTYRATGEVAALMQIADDVTASVHVYGLPGVPEALRSAPSRPTPPIHALDDVFAELLT